MKVLVATPLQVLLVDTETGIYNVVEKGHPEYYGVTWSESQMIYSHSNLDCYNLRTAEDYAKSEKGTINEGLMITAPFLSAPHQIVKNGDTIYATNTGRNCVATVGRGFGTDYENTWIDGVKWDRLGPNKCGSHFNSIYVVDDKIYLLGHNWDNPSKVYVLNKHNFKIIGTYQHSDVRWAHNIWPNGERILVCNSMNHSVFDIKNGETLWSCKHITRGLAVTDNFVVVGGSAHDGSRDARKGSNAMLYVLNRKNMTTIKEIPMHGVGCINEVRVADTIDYAHLENWVPCPLL